MRSVVMLFVTLALLGGCAAQRCDKLKPYQQSRPSPVLRVPSDLSDPPVRGRAPVVEQAERPATRADGRCLEEPPVFRPEEVDDDNN